MPIYRAAARTIAFQSLTTAGAANTSTTPTVTVSIDGGAPAASTNAAIHVGGGYWKVTLTQLEMTGDCVVIVATASGCIPSQREIYPEQDWTSARSVKVDNLDATITSRSTYAGADTAGTTTLLARLTAPRATLLDNLDAAITSRSTYAGADTPGTTTLLTRLSSQRAGNLDFLDVAVSSVASGGGDSPGITTLLDLITPERAENLDNLDSPTSSRTGFKLASDGVDAIAVESGINLRQATSATLAAAVGKLAGADTGSIVIKAAGSSVTRITADTDENGNRDSVNLYLPA